jgi:hypothetical protein
MKRNQEQRKQVLLAAWPNMATVHRPDFHALRSESIQQRREGTRLRDAYMLPFINLEDLMKAKNLLLFLNSRGHNTPGVFASADLKTQKIALASRAVVPKYLDHYVMLLTGQTTPKTYGRLVPIDEATPVHQLPGLGMLVLEVQEKLLRFLVKCAELIVGDLLEKDLPSPPSGHIGTLPTISTSVDTE